MNKIALWRNDPVQFVRDNFKVEPDCWQAKALKSLATKKEGVSRVCLKACAGPGKSAMLAWIGLWFLSIHCGKGEHPRGIAVSVSADNLRDNLWPEFAKWMQRSAFLTAAFTWQKERIFANDHPETWYLSARSFARTADSQEQGRVLSGLHSEFVLVLLDETGDMAPSVGRAAEQAMGNCRRGIIAQAGNPTSQSGLLYDSSVRNRALWDVTTITSDPDDPDRTPRVDIEWAREQIAKEGRDNPWVQAYILGQFPTTGFNSLLSSDEVEAAIKRSPKIEHFDWAPQVVGCDVARFGDDRTVIWRRQGQYTLMPDTMRGARTEEIAGRVALRSHEQAGELRFDAQGIYVDGSGGYGAGVVDALRLAGQKPTEVQFAGKADDPRFGNKRAEMYWRMAEWVKREGSLPNLPELVSELTCAKYFMDAQGRIMIESKEQIKKRIGKSPDLADGLALTFAVLIPPKAINKQYEYSRVIQQQKQYDPLRRRL